MNNITSVYLSGKGDIHNAAFKVLSEYDVQGITTNSSYTIARFINLGSKKENLLIKSCNILSWNIFIEKRKE